MINANSTYNTADSTLIRADNYSISCYLVGSGNRNLNNPLVWSSTSGGTPADILGSELITNAADREFSSDTGFWAKTSAAVTIADGVCHFINAPNYQLLRKDNLFVLGHSYKITYTIKNYVSGKLRVFTGQNGNIRTANGTYSELLVATSNTLQFSTSDSVGYYDIDDISIQEVLCFPNSSNPAIIDANSSIANGDVLSLSAQFDCGGFDCSAAAYTFTLSNAAYAFNVYGDLKDSTKRVNGFSSTGYLYFKGSSNIYSNGATQGWNRIYFDGVGATFTNQDDWNVGSSSIRLANGEWNTNNYTFTSTGVLTYEIGTKTLTLGSSIFNISYTAAASVPNLTINAGTSTVISGANFYAGGKTWYNVIITGFPSYSNTFIDSGTFNNLTFTGGYSISAGVSITGNLIVNNIFTITGYNASANRILIPSNTIGTPRTITVNGSIVASNVDFRDITLAGTANRDLSAISGGSGDCGGNSGITFTPSQTQYYKHTSGACSWSDATKWVTSSGGSTQGRVPLPQDDPIFDQNSFTGASTLSVNCPRIGRSLNMEAVNQAVNFSLANNVESYGSYVLGQNITQSGSFENRLRGRGDYSINVYNSAFTNITITAYTGKYSFLNHVNSQSGTVYCSLGTLDFNDYNINILQLYILGTGIVYYGNGIITYYLTSGTAQQYDSGTLYSEGSTIRLNPSSGASNVTFNGGGKTFNKIIFSGQHTGNFIIGGSNTFNELVIEKGRKVQITGASTQTISPTGKFIADGTPTEQIQITSTNITPFNLVYAGTGFHQVNYCNISYCNATANRFYAGKNSTDGGNNTGWKFRSYLAQNTQII